MQFTQDSHQAVADGSITVTFRLWKRPHAKVGGHYTVGSVVIEADAIEMLPFHAITRSDIRARAPRTARRSAPGPRTRDRSRTTRSCTASSST